MRHKHLIFLLPAILFFTSINNLYAQQILYNTPGFVERIQVGYSFYNNFAEQRKADYYFSGFGGDTVYVDNPDTRIVRNLGGYGFSIGNYFPLTRFGTNIAALALTVEYMYNFMSWEELDSGFAYRPTIKEHKRTDFTIQMGIPVSLDFKLGAEAGPTYNHKWTAGIGGGVSSVIAFTGPNKNAFKEADKVANAYIPFMKFEYGQRIGVMMKLRLMVFFGGPVYLDEGSTYGSAFGRNSYSLTGKTGINLSFAVYPFSYTWQESGWWQ